MKKAADQATRSAKSKKATIVAVAEYAGVSPATASNALSGRRHVDEGTRKRVEDAARALSYRPNIGARRMRMEGCDTIGIFSSTPLSISGGSSRLGFMMEIAEAAAVKAMEHGVAVMLFPPGDKHLLQLDTLQLDGAILIEPLKRDPYLEALRRRQIPVVSIGQPWEISEEIPYIDLKVTYTADLVLNHLWDCGARHICLITAVADRHSHIQISEAYMRFVASRSTRPILQRLDEREGEEGGFLAAMKVLSRFPEIDAIFASVDTFASGAMRAAIELGRTIPERLKIATRHDGVRAISHSPPITAVRLHLSTAADQAVEYLIPAMRGDVTKLTTNTLPMPELVIRPSTSWEDQPPSRDRER